MLRLTFLMVVLTGPVAGQVVRDSAGIQIIESDRPLWDAGAEWTVSGDPSISIGSIDGAAELLFSGVRSVLLASSGAIVVADRGSGQVRFFDVNGRYEGSYGSLGEGPGDFMALDWVGECREGQLLAYDVRLARVTEVGTAPSMTSPIRPGGDGAAPQQVHCLGAGLVGMTRVLPAPVPGPIRGLARLEFFRTDSGAVMTKQVLGDDRYFEPPDLAPRPLGRRTVIASSGDLVALGTQDTPEVSFYDDRGVLQRVVRWSDTELAVRGDDIEAYVDGLLDGASSERATAIRALYRDHEFPEYLPAFGRLLFDQAGNLWVERTRRPGESGNSWRVISPSGVLLGSVHLPERFDPMSISASRIAGVWRDDFDVEYVWVLDLTR